MDGLHHWLPYDLTSPDGRVVAIENGPNAHSRKITVRIEKIPPNFVGFELPQDRLIFNLKSTLAQIGLDGIKESLILDRKTLTAECHIQLNAIGSIAQKMLPLIEVGAIIGKIFAADERRRVRNPDYLSRMFGRSDRWGRPLLSLGGYHGSDDLILDKVDGRCIAYLTLLQGSVTYDASIEGFLPTLAKGLKDDIKMRDLVRLHQVWVPGAPRSVEENELLLVKTLPLHIRTVFGVVVDDLLSPGFHHTTASVLQPDTYASGDIYELYGSAKREITDIPLEFYTLEPYREFVFFSDRDQLQSCLDTPKVLFDAFKTAPGTISEKAAVFVVKGTQMLQLKPEDWTLRPSVFHELPGSSHATRQALMVERFIEQQPEYAFLKQIDDEVITSQGVLLTRYFPSPLMKRMYLSDQVQRSLKAIYFQYASQSHPGFFSHEDRAFLHDLDSFGIPVFWLDDISGQILQYVQKRDATLACLFLPLK
jgi:hypothetical protein